MRIGMIWFAMSLGLMGLWETPWAAEMVKAGDKVLIDCTCRLKNGEVAATTSGALARDPSVPKAPVFLPTQEYRAVLVVAGDGGGLPQAPNLNRESFEGEISRRLAPGLVGMAVGEKKTMELASEVPAGLKPDDRFLQMARVRQRAKEIRMSRDQYRFRTGKDPEVGQDFVLDPAIPGKVAAVTDTEVVVRFAAQPGQRVKTPFGAGVIRETEKNWEIVIDAREGDLVRSGPLVGRIVDVDERMIAIDYGHPFGGEKLTCDVTVDGVEGN